MLESRHKSVLRRCYNWESITRKGITREEFITHCNEWNNKYGENINKQLKFLGSPLDWEKYFYTLDDARSKSVKDIFINLFNKGKIYRAERLINWDCTLQTVISDNYVEYKTINKRTLLPVPNHKHENYPFGVLAYFWYKIAGKSNETVLIETTRLETMLDDEAIAVNSKDPCYSHLHGKRVYHPFRKFTIPIIINDDLVDIEFALELLMSHQHIILVILRLFFVTSFHSLAFSPQIIKSMIFVLISLECIALVQESQFLMLWRNLVCLIMKKIIKCD